MSTLVLREIQGKDGQPVSFPTGILSGAGYGDIGLPGTQGFGVGVCATPPAGMAKMAGTDDPASDNYGNYIYADGSVMVWIPAFYYKYGTGVNGLAINQVDIKPFSYFTTVAVANALGYALHRAFYDNGLVQAGFFIDKYLPSNNAGTASSLKNGNPLSTNGVHNPISGLTGAPANFYYGTIAAAKTRGATFFVASQFQRAALALLALAHGQAATSTAWCAWYDVAGVMNFPKGCNNNALGDQNDAAILYVTDGYSNAAKTGSANLFSRTTHNGQNCGVCDLNGDLWEVSPGLTVASDVAKFYVLGIAAQMKAMTAGAGGGLDLWGTEAQILAAGYQELGATYGALTASSSQKLFGAAAQVLSEATSGLAWQAAGAGIPLVGGVGGANLFGNDGLWDYTPASLCPRAGGAWSSGADAGVWALYLGDVRGGSYSSVGFRAALYL